MVHHFLHTNPYKMSIFERSVTCSFFFRNCTHILTRTQRKKVWGYVSRQNSEQGNLLNVSIFSNLNQRDFEGQNKKVCRKRVSLSGASFERNFRLIYHYSWHNFLHLSVLTHWIKSGPNINALRVEMIKECSTESNALSKSAENKMASISFSSVYSRMSLIKRTDSPILLLHT